ncbi:MAG: AI-2E family transporter [Methylovirgula sp.]
MFWAAALAFIGMLLWLFNGVIMPFAAAFVIAYLMDPLADYLQRRGMSRLAATLFILFGIVFVLALILVLVVPVLAHQSVAFIQALPGLLNKLQSLVSGVAGKLNSQYAEPVLRKLGYHSPSVPEMRASVGDIAGQAAGWFVAFSIRSSRTARLSSA